MNRMRATLCAFPLVLVFVLNHAVVASASMPLPSGITFYKFAAEATPHLTDDPASAKPVVIGGLDEGGDSITFKVGSNPWAGPVDIYFGSQILPFGPEVNLSQESSGRVFRADPDQPAKIKQAAFSEGDAVVSEVDRLQTRLAAVHVLMKRNRRLTLGQKRFSTEFRLPE